MPVFTYVVVFGIFSMSRRLTSFTVMTRQTCSLPMPSAAKLAEYVPPCAGSEAASTSLFAQADGSPPLSESSHSSTSRSPTSPPGAVTDSSVPFTETSRAGIEWTTIAAVEFAAVTHVFVTVPATNEPLPELPTNDDVAQS